MQLPKDMGTGRHSSFYDILQIGYYRQREIKHLRNAAEEGTYLCVCVFF